MFNYSTLLGTFVLVAMTTYQGEGTFVLVVMTTYQGEAHVNSCRKAIKKDNKALMDMVYFLVEENKDCHCELIKLQEKLNISTGTMKDCKEHYKAGQRQNEVYSVSPDGKTKFKVYCDMENGGWTIIQRRINGAVNFDHGWTQYVAGFGDLMADHWLGLHYIHLLARSPRQISFEFMMTGTKKMATAVYDGFQVGDASTNYKMNVSPKVSYNKEMSKHITSRNGFYFHNGMQFSTKDRDNDIYGGKCTDNHPGAWWYKDCFQIAQINGKFENMNVWDTKNQKVSTSEVKIQ